MICSACDKEATYLIYIYDHHKQAMMMEARCKDHLEYNRADRIKTLKGKAGRCKMVW